MNSIDVIEILSSDDEVEGLHGTNDQHHVVAESSSSPTTDRDLMERLKSHCWKCQEPLQIAGLSKSAGDNVNDTFCCYKMHLHPLFEVPICFVCERDVAAVETDFEAAQQKGKNDNGDANESEWCSGCGTHEDDVDSCLWYCEECPRATCNRCVEQANGGKAMDPEASENSNWKCPYCSPPTPLLELKSCHAEIMSCAFSSEDGKNGRSALDVLRELEVVESKKKECEQVEERAYLDQIREEIRQEIERDRRNDANDEDIEEAVEEEFSFWLNDMQRHEERLSDMASALQDEIAMNHPEVDVKQFYASIGHLPNGSNDDGVATEHPEWKVEAERAMAQRDAEARSNRKGRRSKQVVGRSE